MDKKDPGAGTGEDWCFSRALYGARPGTVQATGRTAQGGFKELQKGRAAMEQCKKRHQCALVPERGTQDIHTCLRKEQL